MTTKQLIISSFMQFKELKNAKNTPFAKSILYLLVLSIIMALPISYQVFQILENIRHDGQQIAQKIPDFSIENGRIQTKEHEGFIYQTNSIIFTFDPEGKRSEKDISSDLIGNILSVGLLKNKLVVAFPNTGGSAGLLTHSPFELDYKNEALKNLTGKQLRKTLNEASLPFWIKAAVFLISIYPSFLNLIVTLLLANFAAYIYARLRLTKATFLDCLKTMIYAISLPTVLATILLIFLPSFDTSAFIAIAGLFIFGQAIKGWPKIKLR
ncbi:hypothetical protein BH747_02610 [Enterococcus villorum]|uniref:DUF1189 domain-containing protein n=1 Tax=Enterococcus villorum TaxID=112904 RepID=A0A1V8YE73_9ENTE|nr:DUF1189 domain-containing protein [Enterococcus villorum]OQO70911.1 hypothetical protein BH747_02610 [Enterococcus villorum]OQO74902.1 hypothetical protein BH744_06910 [Enterococcus villorum]